MDYKTNHIHPKLCIFVRTFRKDYEEGISIHSVLNGHDWS